LGWVSSRSARRSAEWVRSSVGWPLLLLVRWRSYLLLLLGRRSIPGRLVRHDTLPRSTDKVRVELIVLVNLRLLVRVGLLSGGFSFLFSIISLELRSKLTIHAF
jgi:hypothetical protein